MSQNVHGTVFFAPSPPRLRVRFLRKYLGNVAYLRVCFVRGAVLYTCVRGHDAAGGYFLKKNKKRYSSRHTVPDVCPSSHRSIVSHYFVSIVGAIKFAVNNTRGTPVVSTR